MSTVTALVEPSAARLAARPSVTSGLASLAPTLAYLATAGLDPRLAMAAAGLASVAVVVARRRRGTAVGLFVPISLGFLAVRTLVGVATGSEVWYFGAGIALSAAGAMVVGATAWSRRPLAGVLLPLATPYRHLGPDHPAYRRVAAQVTAVWAVAELTVTVLEARHLLTASGAEFVVARTVVAWPAMAAVVFLLIAYTRFRLDPVEWHLARSVEPVMLAERIR